MTASAPDIFFLAVLVTVALTRIWLFRRPMGSPKIGNFKLHHYMYGVIILALGLALHKIILFGVGFGLLIDEIPLALFPKNASWEEYESKKTFTGVLVILVIVFIFRGAITAGF